MLLGIGQARLRGLVVGRSLVHDLDLSSVFSVDLSEL